MTLFVSSDHHFYHENVIKYSNRPFKNVEEMNEVMIERWNSIVPPKGITYYLGDLFLTSKIELIEEILSKLNGKIKLIKGNHDSWVSKIPKLKDSIRNKIISVEDYSFHKFSFNGKRCGVAMMHFPILNWQEKHYGSIHLHGHSHERPDPFPHPFRKNVGVDINDFYPHDLIKLLNNLVYSESL